MGSGDIFRAAAQGLLGAGSGAANYALDRDADTRKQKRLLEYLAAAKEHKELLPIEEEKLRAEINNLNRRNSGDGTAGPGGKQKLLKIYNSETGTYRWTPEPTKPGSVLQLAPNERLVSNTGEAGNEPDPYVPTPVEPPEKPGIFSRMFGGGNPPAASPAPAQIPTLPQPQAAGGQSDILMEARAAIAGGANPDAVKARLLTMGITLP